MTRKVKIVASITATLLLVGAVGGTWIWHKRGTIIKEVAMDLHAGAKARNAEKPFEKFLDYRYGPMTEATNRQKAFLGFFDSDHLEGMYRLVGYMTPGERQTNIAATAEWLAKYRETMTMPEKETLAEWVTSEEGRANLQRASALYRSRDVGYRSATEPVIRELMTTLATLQKEGTRK